MLKILILQSYDHLVKVDNIAKRKIIYQNDVQELLTKIYGFNH